MKITDVQIEDFTSKLSKFVVSIYQKVNEFSSRTKTEIKRTYYIIHAFFIRFYQQLPVMHQGKHRKSKQRLVAGVQKLIEANTSFKKMQEQLSKLESVLTDKPNSIEEMLLKIKQDQAETDKMKETLTARQSWPCFSCSKEFLHISNNLVQVLRRVQKC